ncbi:MAG TPA: PAS domain S-box protein [Candidatus Obscuribacterales bacterium]
MPSRKHIAFKQRCEEAAALFASMRHRLHSGGLEPAEVLQELGNVLEELEVSSEELRVQSTELKSAHSKIEAERQRYEELFEFAPDSYLVLDTNGVIVECNRAAAALLNRDQSYLMGKPFALFIAASDKKVFRSRIAHLVHHPQSGAQLFELEIQPQSRSALPAFTTMGCILDANQAAIGIRCILHDMSSVRRLEKERTELAAMVESSNDPIFGVDGRGIIRNWNKGSERLFGYKKEEIVGKHVDWLLPVKQGGSLSERINECQDHAEFEMVCQSKKGTDMDCLVTVSAMQRSAANEQLFAVVIRDMTQSKRANQLLQTALRRAVEAQEEERQRISRELHDHLGQGAAALMYGLASLSNSGPMSSQQQQELSELHNLSCKLAKDVHTISWELRPAALDDLGLPAALEQLVRTWSDRSKIAAELEIAGVGEKRFSTLVETSIFRIAQEALTNVLKHSGASLVSVVLRQGKNGLLLIVEDDGRGVLLKTNASNVGSQQLGLTSMKYRAASAGGTLEIESSPGKGVAIFVRIPFANLASASEPQA